jgi:hypothetical protein
MHFIWAGPNVPRYGGGAGENLLKQWIDLLHGQGWTLYLWGDRHHHWAEVYAPKLKQRLIWDAAWDQGTLEHQQLTTGLTRETRIRLGEIMRDEIDKEDGNPNYASMSDILRAELLFLYGGFYSDIDNKPKDQARQLHTITGNNDEQIVVGGVYVDRAEVRMINNGFMGSKKGHAFWLYYLKSIAHMYSRYVYNATRASALEYFNTIPAGAGLRWDTDAINRMDAARMPGLMREVKRAGSRGMTIMLTGPYLVRSCLYQYFEKFSLFGHSPDHTKVLDWIRKEKTAFVHRHRKLARLLAGKVIHNVDAYLDQYNAGEWGQRRNDELLRQRGFLRAG